jgi:hypothetical protein
MKKIPIEWRKFHMYDSLSRYLLLLGWVPAVLLSRHLKTVIGISGANLIFNALIAIWLLLWAFIAFKSIRIPCPRCKTPWLIKQTQTFKLNRSCSKCSLGLYEAP